MMTSYNSKLVHVYGVGVYELSYDEQLLNITKEAASFRVNWKSLNPNLFSTRYTIIVVSSGCAVFEIRVGQYKRI